jgi:hypothetical protein
MLLADARLVLLVAPAPAESAQSVRPDRDDAGAGEAKPLDIKPLDIKPLDTKPLETKPWPWLMPSENVTGTPAHAPEPRAARGPPRPGPYLRTSR